MFESFTERAIKVIMLAQEESRRLGHNFVGTEQILLGLIGEEIGVAARVLDSMGVRLKQARIEVENIIGRGSGFVSAEIPFTQRAKNVLKLSIEEARELGDNYIATEHLLLGLIKEEKGVAVRVLENLGCSPIDIRKTILNRFKNTFSQVVLDGGNIKQISIDGVVQRICKTINTKLSLKPGEKIPDFQEIITARMSVLQGVNADTIKIKDVIQLIQLTVNQYVTVTSEELAEIIFDSFSVILDPQESRDKKKEAILWALKSIVDQEGLPNDEKESFQNLYNAISSMAAQDFDTALTSKDSRLKQRIGKVMIFSGGTASGVTISNYEAIIRELEKYNSPPSSGGEVNTPSNTFEQNDSQKYKKRSRDDENLRRGVPVTPVENFPVTSSRGGGGIFPSDKSTDGIQGSDHPSLSDLSAMNSSSFAPEVGGGGGHGDCDAFHIGDCDGCEPSCDCFIATAVYGNYNASQVVTLRYFRDTKLMPYYAGRLFVEMYYHFSPPIAEKLKDLPHLAKPIRHVLDMFVKWLER
jgi:Clp amino terminal domain, pathogenicity island component